MTRWIQLAIIPIIYLFIGLLFIWPAPQALLEGKTIGIWGDEITMPYFIWWVQQLSELAPLSLLNGALYSPQMGAPQGYLIWMPYIERIIALLMGPFLDPVQTVTALVLFLYWFAALSAYWLGLRMGIGRNWAFCLGLAYAFTPFMYWRSFQHIALMGIYALPLVFIAMDLMRSPRGHRDWGLAVSLLVLAATTGHYLVLVLLTVIPVAGMALVWKASWRKRALVVAAFIPFFSVILWIKLMTPLQVDDLRPVQPLYTTPRPENSHSKWDVMVFSAKPVDYLSGNFDTKSFDINPLRQWITHRIRESHGDHFYPQEHSAGIRWVLLVFFALGVWQYFVRKKRDPWILIGLWVFAIGYFCSLSPRAIAPLGIGMAPSRWIHELVPAMRAPNRWCVAAHLGVLIIAFQAFRFWIEPRMKRLKLRQRNWVVVAGGLLVFLEFLPTFKMPVRETQPLLGAELASIPELEKDCGFGVELPYHYNSDGRTYRLVASLRGTECRILNGQQTTQVDHYLKARLGEKQLESAETGELLACLGVEWIRLRKPRADAVCERLGYQSRGDRYCVASGEVQAPGEDWVQCLSGLKL